MDDAVRFLDDGFLPCILVENKVDLLEPNDAEDINSLKEFADNNEFNGFFRTSAKTGQNINESMECLIKIIIKRIDDMSAKNEIVVERNTISLNKERQSDEEEMKRKKKEGCCKS